MGFTDILCQILQQKHLPTKSFWKHSTCSFDTWRIQQPPISKPLSESSLVGYSDSDWGGDIDDRKSTSGFVFFMGNTAFTWMSKKQPIVTLSTCEAEYVAATSSEVMVLILKTRDYTKTNAEFRNEINEILAQHESCFDQVNVALHAILIELQSLRNSRSPHKVDTELNPFAEQYFDFKSIAVDQQVQLVSFHLEGIALQWHRWFTKFKGPLTWDEFTQAMLQRFGPTDFEDPSEALTRLKQTTTDEICLDVKIKQPSTLADTIGVARLIEERNQLQKTPMATKENPNPIAGLLGPPPSTTPTTFQRITSQEARARREKGLCYYCDEKYVPGHHCQQPQFFMIQDSPQSDYFPADAGQFESTPTKSISQFCPCGQG
ncbi:hypothetical protein ACOSQ2_004572 [Xanthoceras sorbifolium]